MQPALAACALIALLACGDAPGQDGTGGAPGATQPAPPSNAQPGSRAQESSSATPTPSTAQPAAPGTVDAPDITPRARRTAKPAPEPVPPPPALLALGWLEGCWQGSVNRREFREVWLPLRGGLMVGVSQTVSLGRTLGYEYLRLEPSEDGVQYVTAPPGQAEVAYRFAGRTTEQQDEIFRFENPAHDFPRRITYRRGSLGWLYAEVEGIVNDAERKVTYPMRRIDCESGDYIEK